MLKEPSLIGLNVGSKEYFELQKALIKMRPLLKYCYNVWYKKVIKSVQSIRGAGLILELGSGGSYLKEYLPDMITSDVVEGVADRVIDARKLPFQDESVKSIILTHAFHHIPDVSLFLREAERVLIPGGKIILIEVAHTKFAKFFFDKFHVEPYMDNVTDWSFDQKDSMMDSNQALSWIVFFRDKLKFRKLFPNLSVVSSSYLPWFSYLISGGVTFRNMIPNFFVPFCILIDVLLSPLAFLFSLHWFIEIEKVNNR